MIETAETERSKSRFETPNNVTQKIQRVAFDRWTLPSSKSLRREAALELSNDTGSGIRLATFVYRADSMSLSKPPGQSELRAPF